MAGRSAGAQAASHPALQDAIDDVFNARIGDVSGRGKLAGDMREIWMMQPRFEKTRAAARRLAWWSSRVFAPRFDFMRLRAETGEIDPEIAEWWEKFSTAYDDERHAMIEGVRQAQLKKPQPQRVRVKRTEADEESALRNPPGGSRTAPDQAQVSPDQGDTAPARKRRRRRKPANRGNPDSGQDAMGSSEQSSSGAAPNS